MFVCLFRLFVCFSFSSLTSFSSLSLMVDCRDKAYLDMVDEFAGKVHFIVGKFLAYSTLSFSQFFL